MSNVVEGGSLLERLRLWWERERLLPTGGSPAARVAQISRREQILQSLVRRDLKKKYATSYLGYVWSLLEPALLISVYWLIFGHVVRLGIHHYVLFLALGVLPFQWFRSCINSSSDVLAGNARLISSINLPREMFPLGMVLTKTVEFLVTLPIVLVVAALYRFPPQRPFFLLLIPVAIFVELMLNLGLTLLFSAWTTLFQDLERALTAMLRLVFYLSPVLYPSTRVTGAIGKLYSINPLVGILSLYRAAWFPHTGLSLHVVAVSFTGSLLAFIGGWAAFIRLEPSVLKEL